jgi:signal transduction histidine kinase
MFRNLFILTVALMAGTVFADETASGVSLKSVSLSRLEQRLEEIEAELKTLASYSLRSGTGTLGYRSKMYQQPDHNEWIRVELGEEVVIDQVVLVPSLFRDSETGPQAEGFPRAFRILAGSAQTTNIVASFSEKEALLPRMAPLAVSFQPIKASWVSIEATTLTPRGWDTDYTLQLAEIFVFSGKDNVALHKPVVVPRVISGHRGRTEMFLTDGFTPYLMDAAQGPRSQTLLINVKRTKPPPTLTIDLKAPYPVNQINLHTAGVNLTIPMFDFSSRAVPRRVRVTGATRSDFADETLLFEYNQKSIYDVGPILMHRFPETQCRYIKLIILDHKPVASLDMDDPVIGFTEIEVLSNGQNIALGAPITASARLYCPPGVLDRMTDGLNFYGQILPLRDWMNQLARRHDLETERPLVAAELTRRYARQQTTLHHLAWLAALLAAGIGFTVLIDRMLRMRNEAQIRERFAADLHDELSANIHSIGMLSDLGQDAESPDEWKATSQRIWDLTERTNTAIRHCTKMLESEELYVGLVQDMKRAAERVSDNFQHEFSIEGESWISQINPRTSIDLFLFYKECLINICRHSKATRIRTGLTATPKEITLTVADNGKGTDQVPASLERRARMLKAKLSVENPAEGGTKITLRLRRRGKR